MSCTVLATAVAIAGPAKVSGSEETTPILTRKHTFYVVTESDKATSIGPVALGVADELNKHLTNNFGVDNKPAGSNPLSRPSDPSIWVIPQPSWTSKDLVVACKDRNALGGVIVTAYGGFATHFWLLWQTETTTFIVFAQLVSCAAAEHSEGPQVVSIVSHLPGAGNTGWIVRRTQTSIPLLTLAAVGSVLSKNGASNGKASNLTLTAIAGSLFTSAGSKDIPGYSDPVRLRLAAQHIGVDVVDAMDWLCSHKDDDGGLSDAHPGAELCSFLRFPKSIASPAASAPPR